MVQSMLTLSTNPKDLKQAVSLAVPPEISNAETWLIDLGGILRGFGGCWGDLGGILGDIGGMLGDLGRILGGS